MAKRKKWQIFAAFLLAMLFFGCTNEPPREYVYDNYLENRYINLTVKNLTSTAAGEVESGWEKLEVSFFIPNFEIGGDVEQTVPEGGLSIVGKCKNYWGKFEIRGLEINGIKMVESESKEFGTWHKIDEQYNTGMAAYSRLEDLKKGEYNKISFLIKKNRLYEGIMIGQMPIEMKIGYFAPKINVSAKINVNTDERFNFPFSVEYNTTQYSKILVSESIGLNTKMK